MPAKNQAKGKAGVGLSSNNGHAALTFAHEYALYRGVLSRVAEKLGVSRSYVSRVMRGERNSPQVHKALERAVEAIRERQAKIRRRRAS